MKAARIIVLGVAVVAGGLAAVMAGRQPAAPPPAPAPVAKVDTTDVLVAKSDIGIGQSVTPGDMQWQAWPTAAAATTSFIRKNDKPNAIEEIAGSLARSPILAGEPIREAKLIKANGSGFMAAILPAGKRAISTEISPETGAGGFILPNDHVDVILSRRDRNSDKSGQDAAQSETILRNVRVLAIDQTVEEKNGQRVVVGKTATLELGPREAETLALSRQLGTLSLALRSIADGGKAGTEESSPRDNGSINTVRFGVTTTATAK